LTMSFMQYGSLKNCFLLILVRRNSHRPSHDSKQDIDDVPSWVSFANNQLATVPYG
jgi:hypothetical protein